MFFVIVHLIFAINLFVKYKFLFDILLWLWLTLVNMNIGRIGRILWYCFKYICKFRKLRKSVKKPAISCSNPD